MKEGELVMAKDLRHGHAGADLDARAGGPHLREAAIGRAHDGGDGGIALIDRAHHERAATEEPGSRGPQ